MFERNLETWGKNPWFFLKKRIGFAVETEVFERRISHLNEPELSLDNKTAFALLLRQTEPVTFFLTTDYLDIDVQALVGGTISAADLTLGDALSRGRSCAAVLFYPADFSAGVREEILDLADKKDKLEELGCKVGTAVYPTSVWVNKTLEKLLLVALVSFTFTLTSQKLGCKVNIGGPIRIWGFLRPSNAIVGIQVKVLFFLKLTSHKSLCS